MGTDSLVTGSGIAGLIVAGVYVGRLLLDWVKDKRKAPVDEATASVGDAATANAVLVASLQSLQAENGRLIKRVRYLETEDQRKAAKITELEQRLADIAHELAALRGDRT